jgi:hypothetical protein
MIEIVPNADTLANIVAESLSPKSEGGGGAEQAGHGVATREHGCVPHIFARKEPPILAGLSSGLTVCPPGAVPEPQKAVALTVKGLMLRPAKKTRQGE